MHAVVAAAQWDNVPIVIPRIVFLHVSTNFRFLCTAYFRAKACKRLAAVILPVLQPASALARVLACSVDVFDFHGIGPFRKNELLLFFTNPNISTRTSLTIPAMLRQFSHCVRYVYLPIMIFSGGNLKPYDSACRLPSVVIIKSLWSAGFGREAFTRAFNLLILARNVRTSSSCPFRNIFSNLSLNRSDSGKLSR